MAAANPAPLLFDTDVLIDFLRKKPAARVFITNAWVNRPALYYASVTVTELFAGIRTGEEAAVQSLLSTMVSIPLTDSIAKDAGDYLRQFRGQGITLSVPDTVIAASAKSKGADLTTLNVKHYPMTDIVVVRPYS
jgi:predicted nucleic acid-binding protein